MSKIPRVIGIDVGKTKIAAGWVRANGQIDHWAETTSPASLDAQRIVRAAVDLADQCMHSSSDAPVAVGIGAPGIIDPASGTVLYGGSIEDWEGMNLADAIGSALGVPTYACNDADAGGLAEHTWGAARGAHRAAYITIGTGLGYALTEGTPTPGIVRPVGPEAAHARLFPAGKTGTASLSGRGLIASVKQLTGEAREPREIFENPSRDRRIAAARAAFVEAAGWLCAAVDVLAKPDVIVLGGGVVQHQTWLGDDIGVHRADVLGRAVLAAPIRVGHLGARAGVAGAGAFALSFSCQ
jgi:glucokinase